jgi:hypothetical protein
MFRVCVGVMLGIFCIEFLCYRARNAKAAVNLLNPDKQDIALSKTLLKSGRVGHIDLGYEADLSYIGSSDSLAPNSVFANIIRNIGGVTNENNVSSC